MSELGVRRGKAAFFSGCNPPGNYRSGRKQAYRHRAPPRLYSSVGLGMSVVGGKAEVDFGRLEVCL